MSETIAQLLIIALAVSAASMTITQTAIFHWLRDTEWFAGRLYWIHYLVHCPYCLSHSLAFAACAIYRPSLWLPLEGFAVVCLSTIFSLAIWDFLEKVDR